MHLNYISIFFELVNGDEKKLSYGHFEPYQFHSFYYHKEKIIHGKNRYTYNFKISASDRENIIIEYVELLLSNTDKPFDSINLISILDKPIEQQYLEHFSFVLDQKSNPELKAICTEPNYSLFDNLDYELDEEEYLCDLRKYSSDSEFELVNECFCDLYCLPKDFDKAREKLTEGLQKINNEIDNGGPDISEFFCEEDFNKYKNMLPNVINWLTSRIKELENQPKPYEQSYIEHNLKYIDEKIKFYKYLKENDLVSKSEINIKICNQILRMNKIRYPEKIRYNLLIDNFTYKKERDGLKHLQIKFFNVIKDIEGIYNFKLKGVYGGYNYLNEQTLEFNTEYSQEVILDEEHLKDIFQGDIFYQLVGYSSGSEPDYDSE